MQTPVTSHKESPGCIVSRACALFPIWKGLKDKVQKKEYLNSLSPVHFTVQDDKLLKLKMIED